MESIRSYIYAIFIVSMTAGVVNILSYGEDKNGVKKSVKFVCSLAVTAVLLCPLKSVFSNFDFSLSLPEADTSLTADTDDAVQAIIDATSNSVCTELEKAIKDQFGAENVQVSIAVDSSDPQNVLITAIYLETDSHFGEAAEYLREATGCAVFRLSEDSHG